MYVQLTILSLVLRAVHGSILLFPGEELDITSKEETDEDLIIPEGVEASPIADEQTNFDDIAAYEYLVKYGYADDTEGDPNSPAGQVSFKAKIKEVQEAAGLQVTGELDAQTQEFMQAPRCGLGREADESVVGEQLAAEQSGRAWHKKTLTYRVQKYSRRVGNADVDRTIRRALNYWEKAADLKFTKTSGGADLEIIFGARRHSNDGAFDGPGGVLAHAYFPNRFSAIAGDAHFDDDESWGVTRGFGKKQLLQTTTHEFGHSLGLSHSKVRGSVMYPTYPGWNNGLSLHQDDIRRIQALYGRSRGRGDGGGNPPPGNGGGNFPVAPTSQPRGRGSCICQDYTRFEFWALRIVGNCRSKYKGRSWCYVSDDAGCGDVQRSSKVNRNWSWQACQGETRPQFKEPTAGTREAHCQCNGMTRYDTRTSQSVGNCLTKFQSKNWCYIHDASSCADKKGTKRTVAGLRYYSTTACQGQTQFQRETIAVDQVEGVASQVGEDGETP